MCLWSEAVSQWWRLFWLILREHPKKLTCLEYQNISVFNLRTQRESISDFLLVQGLKINLPRNSLRSLNLYYVSLTRKNRHWIISALTWQAVMIIVSLPEETSLLIITGFLPEKSVHRKRKSEQPSPKKIKWINCTSELKGY